MGAGVGVGVGEYEYFFGAAGLSMPYLDRRERERDEGKKRKGEKPPAKRSMMEGGRGRVIEIGMVTGIVVLGSWRGVVLGSWGRMVQGSWGGVVGRLYRMLGERLMWRLWVEGERFRVVVGRRFG